MSDQATTDPQVGDRVEYAGEDELITGHVVQLGKPEHREALIEDDETGHKSWHLFDYISVIHPATNEESTNA